MYIKIKKGLDVNIQGSAPRPADYQSVGAVNPAVVAICPDDFPGFTPKASVKEGEAVKAGEPIFFDKNHPDIKLVAPVSGTIKAVVRGERRKLERIELTPNAIIDNAAKPAESEDFKMRLKQSGLWCMMRQRPFDIIPDADARPRDIFVTAYDSSPLAPHLEYAVMGYEAELEAAVKALSALTDGKVYVCVPDGSPLAPINGAEWVIVSGPHPSGQVGPQIAAIAPVCKGQTVWTLDVVTLCKIGQLALYGRYSAEVLVTVAGPMVKTPRYVRTIIGADVKSLLDGQLELPEESRIISGSVLTGERVSLDGFLHYPYRQISVIAEGSHADEFMGWAALEAWKPSTKRSVLGHFMRRRKFAPDARINGGRRALIMSGEYDRLLPMDILGEYLIKAIMAHDIEQMEQLGIYEVAPEDFALPEFACTSKLPLQEIVRQGLDYMRTEA